MHFFFFCIGQADIAFLTQGSLFGSTATERGRPGRDSPALAKGLRQYTLGDSNCGQPGRQSCPMNMESERVRIWKAKGCYVCALNLLVVDIQVRLQCKGNLVLKFGEFWSNTERGDGG
jgi:hypothetical protein